jgi:hypothetical protein
MRLIRGSPKKDAPDPQFAKRGCAWPAIRQAKDAPDPRSATKKMHLGVAPAQ